MIKEIKAKYYIFCAIFGFTVLLAVFGNLLPLLGLIAGYVFANVTQIKEEKINKILESNEKNSSYFHDVPTDVERLNSLYRTDD